MTEPDREGVVVTSFWRRCETCDIQGPELPTGIADLREFHRALHHLGRTYAEVLHIPHLCRLLAKAMS
jgi:hypothetical protein